MKKKYIYNQGILDRYNTSSSATARVVPLRTNNANVTPLTVSSTSATVTASPGYHDYATTVVNLNGNTYPYSNQVADNWYTTPNYHQTFPIVSGFDCHSSTEGRIAEGKLEIIFNMLAETKLSYEQVIKHLGMEPRLFNTVLLEYALKFKPRFFIELLSHKQSFTKEELFDQVVKSYC